jgi:serine/threonine-protein kinase
VKLLDFGIARSRHDSRLTGQGELFGTPQYMAPERIMGQDVGAPSDLYALGVVFYEMLIGELPFNAPDVATFFMKHMQEPAPSLRARNLRVPESLDLLVRGMLEKDPKSRPVSAHRVHQELLAIVAEREIEAPPTAGEEPVSVPAPVTMAQGAADQWARRIFVLEQMLSRAFGAKARAPGELTELLDQVNRLVRKVANLRTEGFEAQRELELIDTKGRDKRTMLGHAVDALGVDVSNTKDELRKAKELLDRAAAESAQARERFTDAHKDVVYWEGRSGLAEPYSDLSSAYRKVADAVDEWLALRQEERKAQEAHDLAERNSSDLDFQLQELRQAMQSHEHDLDEARAKAQQTIETSGAEADRLETELLELTTKFCKPLRARPELAPLFKELETEAA